LAGKGNRDKNLHFPVLREEVVDFLDLSPGDVVLDATLGGGGHTAEALKMITPGGRVVAVDRDIDAIERFREKFSESLSDMLLVNGNFKDIVELLRGNGINKIDGAIFDLGFSSFQLDDVSRGFSFQNDGPLDMRFNRADKLTAFEVVNTFGKDELAGIIREYGEERHSRKIASAIVDARKTGRIQTTKELANIIRLSVGRMYSNQKIDPSCRTFQAIRIRVNDEMAAAEKGIAGAVSMLSRGGRICVISFHSLEDRIAKNIFKKEARLGALEILTRKPVLPSREEVRNNPRSRSAKLRAAERIK